MPDRTEALLKFRPAPELQARIEALAAKSTENNLSEAERAEHECYVRANKFVAILRRQAQQMIASPS